MAETPHGDELDDFLREDFQAWGDYDRCSQGTSAELIGYQAAVVAELSALRSSLEEARKDSERLRAALDQARQALQSLASPTRFNLSPLIDPTTELRVRREFAEIGRAAATSALTPPRAPSPRDEP